MSGSHVRRRLPLAFLTPLLIAAAASADVLPRSTFLRGPAVRAVTMSPRGTWIVYVAPDRDGLRWWRWRPDDGVSAPEPLRSLAATPGDTATWVADGERLLVRSDPDGDGRHQLVTVDVARDAARRITPATLDARIVGVGAHRPDDVLVAVDDAAGQRVFWRLDTRDGATTVLSDVPDGTTGVFADARLDVRFAELRAADGGSTVAGRDADGTWYELVRWSAEERERSRLLGLSADGRQLFLIDAREGNTNRLYRYGPPVGGPRGLADEPVYENLDDASDAEADIGEVLVHPRTGVPEAVARDGVRRTWRALDTPVAVDLERLTAALGPDVSILARDLGDRRWLWSAPSADGPDAYGTYDRREGRIRRLFRTHPQLERAALGRTEAHRLRVRGGLELPAYLTRPPGDGPDAPARPMVVLVSGDPWAPVRFGFDPVVAWLADRGYVVLRVNVRGTDGYGNAFTDAGRREWAGARHDDLVDAVNWAVDGGIADADRLAIVGASYGGYAALVASTFTPDFFTCAVSIGGPAHVRPLFSNARPESRLGRRLDARVARRSETEFLDQISPLTRAADVRRPLLIAHGAADERAPLQDIQLLVARARGAGADVTALYLPAAGHRLTDPVTSDAVFGVVEAFLARHLGGRTELEMEAALARTRETGIDVDRAVQR